MIPLLYFLKILRQIASKDSASHVDSPCYLFGTESDLRGDTKAMSVSNKIGTRQYFECSALAQEGVKLVFAFARAIRFGEERACHVQKYRRSNQKCAVYAIRNKINCF
jgi:hypothetical protein